MPHLTASTALPGTVAFDAFLRNAELPSTYRITPLPAIQVNVDVQFQSTQTLVARALSRDSAAHSARNTPASPAPDVVWPSAATVPPPPPQPCDPALPPGAPTQPPVFPPQLTVAVDPLGPYRDVRRR